MEYEVIKRSAEVYEVWTPDGYGACIGGGDTEIAALENAASNMTACVAEIKQQIAGLKQ